LEITLLQIKWNKGDNKILEITLLLIKWNKGDNKMLEITLLQIKMEHLASLLFMHFILFTLPLKL
jgi:hypothetical protein